jgi:hypothetical protein
MRWDQEVIAARPRLAKFNDAAVRRIFKRRNIHEDVWRARPYTPYDAGDLIAVLKAEPGFNKTDGLRESTRAKVDQRPGLVMARSGFFESQRQLAQLRPFRFKDLDPKLNLSELLGREVEDEGVFMYPSRHDHHADVWHAHRAGRFIFTTAPNGQSIAPTGPSSSTTLPVRRDRDAASEAERREQRAEAAERWMRTHIENEHDGIPPSELEVHSHPSMPDPAHLTNEHEGRDLRGPHSHDHYAKYLYSKGMDIPARDGRAAYRSGEPHLIDCHPLARQLVEDGGDICYFALEGLLKADAILSVG